ncbi:helix-turn-helix domain-containing protein [Pseudomonas sp. PA15(2017)]|uniref:AraC family transcriptional regulator n=1 Tax=Pseudomonas sp. PA15(2017) TaxID=1932111 RepID=UPI0009FB7AC0
MPTSSRPQSVSATFEHDDPDEAKAQIVGITESWQPGGLDLHCHTRHQLMYSIKGVMHVVTPFGRWVLPPSRAIWIAGGVQHAFMAKRPVDLHALYIDPAVADLPKWEGCVVVNVTPLVRELVASTVTLPWDYPTDSPAARLTRVLLEQLVDLPQAPVNLPEPEDPRAKRAVAMLRADPTARYSLQELASASAASARTLERIFHADTGMSFSEWRHRLRLLIALEMLADDVSVNRVANAVGYSNPSSFISAFRSLFGMTPGNYFR